MIRFLVTMLIVGITSLGMPIFVFAQDDVEPIVTRVLEGEVVPFTGTLLNDAATAQMLAEQETRELQCELRTQYEVDRVTQHCDMLLQLSQVSLDSLQERYDSILQIRQDEIDRLTEIAIEGYVDNDVWWFAGGTILGVVASIGIAFAVGTID